MTPLDRDQKISIITRTEFIRVEIRDLETMGKITFPDYRDKSLIRRNVERIAENVINACIDIGKVEPHG